jgi:hypothetical protein
MIGLIQTDTIIIKPACNSAEMRMIQQFHSKSDSRTVTTHTSLICFKVRLETE